MTASRRQRSRRDFHAVGLFVVETRGSDGHWLACSTRGSERAALDCAWELLSRAGGDVRVRLGACVIAEGHRYRAAT